MNTNQTVINRFYESFSQLDYEAMKACYHPKATFKDSVFGKLDYEETCAMWQMLIERSKGNLSIEYFNVTANEIKGSAQWIAAYTFSKTNRPVRNVVQAFFVFKNNLIIEHTDIFDVWKWSSQALGIKGKILGWSPLMKGKIRQQAKKNLLAYISKKGIPTTVGN